MISTTHIPTPTTAIRAAPAVEIALLQGGLVPYAVHIVHQVRHSVRVEFGCFCARHTIDLVTSFSESQFPTSHITVINIEIPVAHTAPLPFHGHFDDPLVAVDKVRVRIESACIRVLGVRLVVFTSESDLVVQVVAVQLVHSVSTVVLSVAELVRIRQADSVVAVELSLGVAELILLLLALGH